jgi:hypothetical protein
MRRNKPSGEAKDVELKQEPQLVLGEEPGGGLVVGAVGKVMGDGGFALTEQIGIGEWGQYTIQCRLIQRYRTTRRLSAARRGSGTSFEIGTIDRGFRKVGTPFAFTECARRTFLAVDSDTASLTIVVPIGDRAISPLGVDIFVAFVGRQLGNYDAKHVKIVTPPNGKFVDNDTSRQRLVAIFTTISSSRSLGVYNPRTWKAEGWRFAAAIIVGYALGIGYGPTAIHAKLAAARQPRQRDKKRGEQHERRSHDRIGGGDQHLLSHEKRDSHLGIENVRQATGISIHRERKSTPVPIPACAGSIERQGAVRDYSR